MRLARTIDNLLQTVEETVSSHRQFLADTSHELRNPILALRTNLDLLDRVHSPAERSECIREATSQIERISNLVAELLVLARIEAGLVLEKQPIALSAVLLGVVSDAQRTAGHRQISFEMLDEDVIVGGDRERLHQVFSNLMENAVRHTADSGNIVVRMTAAGDSARVNVEDDGVGIAAEHLLHVFERFYRVDGMRGQGTGLGLAIVKHLVELHGGSVSVASTLGIGTCFTVVLPAMLTGSDDQLVRQPAPLAL
jgi:signal transduction histidine kinase